jgi:hypothetical protein
MIGFGKCRWRTVRGLCSLLIRQRPANPLILHDRGQSGSMQVGVFWSVIWSTLPGLLVSLLVVVPRSSQIPLTMGVQGGGHGPEGGAG